jgi:hypothetical protein
LLDRDGRPIRIGNFGFLHVRDLSRLSIIPPAPRQRKPIDRTPAPEIVKGFARLRANRRPGEIDRAAGRLGLPAESLSALGCETEGAKIYTPERDAAGRIIGYQERRGNDKRNHGHRGLVYRDDWRQRAIEAGSVLLVEGMTDTAACEAMGLPAIGRPSNTGGVGLLAELLPGLPAAVRIVAVGERDQGDGKWPGRDGAESTAESLSKRLGRPVGVAFPPGDAKDTRAWFNAQRPALDDQAGLRALGVRFTAGLTAADGSLCSCRAVAPHCPDSRVLLNGSVRDNSDNTPQLQGNCEATASYPGRGWRVSKEIREKYHSHAWDCPHVRGAGGLADLSPALIAATCRKRSCPVCGQFWKLQTFIRFGTHLANHDGQLYTDTVPDFDWGAVLKDMRRRAGRLDVPLRFVSLRDEDGGLTVLASVPIRPDVARPVDLAGALELLEIAIDQADPGPRPVNACRAWGKLETEREADRVFSTGCSPAAFKATVKAWGSNVPAENSLRRVIRPAKSRMFADAAGNLDAQAQCDFWREAETWDFAGVDAARETHDQLAAARKQRRPAAPSTSPPTVPCAVCSPADRIEQTSPDGQRRQVCGRCGRFYGRLPAGPAVDFGGCHLA